MPAAPAPTTKTAPELATGTVGDVMSAGVISCVPETPLRSVARMMATYRVHSVVVFSHDDAGIAPWGVVSDTDLVTALAAAPSARSGAVAASPVVTVTPDEPLLRAAERMRDHATTHLLVVDGETALPIGVLSTLDVARAFAAECEDWEFAPD